VTQQRLVGRDGAPPGRGPAFLATETREDTLALAELLASGDLTAVIDRTYALADAPEAVRYLQQGHTQGKVVITV
jgi:NADPH:quinone reductase-like Zn-dependent oxidoreductase